MLKLSISLKPIYAPSCEKGRGRVKVAFSKHPRPFSWREKETSK